MSRVVPTDSTSAVNYVVTEAKTAVSEAKTAERSVLSSAAAEEAELLSTLRSEIRSLQVEFLKQRWLFQRIKREADKLGNNLGYLIAACAALAPMAHILFQKPKWGPSVTVGLAAVHSMAIMVVARLRPDRVSGCAQMVSTAFDAVLGDVRQALADPKPTYSVLKQDQRAIMEKAAAALHASHITVPQETIDLLMKSPQVLAELVAFERRAEADKVALAA